MTIRRFVETDEVGILLAHDLGHVIAVVPPSNRGDLTQFDVELVDAAAATIVLSAFGAGELTGDLKRFANELRRVRRMIREGRRDWGGDARPESRDGR